MKIPLHITNLKVVTNLEQETPLGTLIVQAIPSWPCYERDGAGTVTNIRLEMYLKSSAGRIELIEDVDAF